MFDEKTKVLVVDDMMTMRKIVINGLKKMNISKIDEADDGATAWPLIEASVSAEKYDLIISDWNMPNMKGIDLLKRCRALEAYESVPFLMVTAEAEQTAVLEAVKERVSNYIVP